jgi:hypothetical protein
MPGLICDGGRRRWPPPISSTVADPAARETRRSAAERARVRTRLSRYRPIKRKKSSVTEASK